MVVEVCCILDGSFVIVHGVRSTNKDHKCPWVLDGYRSSWTMEVKLDYELVAI